MNRKNRVSKVATMIVAGVCLFNLRAQAAESVKVNVDNFVRAETAGMFDRTLSLVNGEVNKVFHYRKPIPLDAQSVIRSNRDTLYSGAVVDISKGATLTIPETNGRYVSVMTVNEDHYINKMFSGSGTYKLTMKDFDTPYVSVTIRTLVNAADLEDVKKVRAFQDGIKIKSNSAKPYTHLNYDQVSYKSTFDSVIELSKGLSDTQRMFGKKEDLGEIRHLIGTAMGWGGLPEQEAYYLTVTPNLPVAAYQLTVKNVPVDAFWSISLYNNEGYFQENKYNSYSVNNVTGTPNKDGSYTVNFGGDSESVNYLHITEGWNYTVRFYQPRKEILKGAWKFPSVKAVK